MTTPPESPDIRRDRISQKLAFPIGYELLRDCFGSSPRWSNTRFTFANRPVLYASEFARILDAQEPYCVLRIEHRPLGLEQLHWHFTVYPVPRQLKNSARDAVVGVSPHLLYFFEHAPSFERYYNRMCAIFNPKAATCSFEQLHPI